MNSAEYIDILKQSLIPFCCRFRKIQFTFQQDNTAIHTSRKIKRWFEDEGIDLNPIENLWTIMVRRLYLNNRQFATVSDLQKDVQEAWDSIDLQVHNTKFGG